MPTVISSRKPRSKTPNLVAAYVARLPAASRHRIQLVRKLVRSVVPDAVEIMSYGMPAFRAGNIFCYCGAFNDHVSIFPPLTTDPALIRDLATHRNAKGNLLFSHAEPFPPALIARVIRALASQTLAKGGKKRPSVRKRAAV